MESIQVVILDNVSEQNMAIMSIRLAGDQNSWFLPVQPGVRGNIFAVLDGWCSLA